MWRLFRWRRDRQRTEPVRPGAESAKGRTQKLAALVRALAFYAERDNYKSSKILNDTSPVTRDGGRRARHVLMMMYNLDQVKRPARNPASPKSR